MYHGLTRWWAPVLLAWTSLMAVAALVAVWLRRFAVARLAAIGQVTLILAGWGLAQYPNLVTPDVTVLNAAAPDRTMRLLVIALGFGAILLLPSLAFLFYIFKGRDRGRFSSDRRIRGENGERSPRVARGSEWDDVRLS